MQITFEIDDAFDINCCFFSYSIHSKANPNMGWCGVRSCDTAECHDGKPKLITVKGEEK